MSGGLLATVLVPTHEHGPLLTLAVRTALGQTVRELEVLIVGDGVDEATREAALGLERSDPRVRFFDNPKGPRHGELHRHAALQHARGRIVCYLSDDDLWLPDHVEAMADALDGADFAHALPIVVGVDGSIRVLRGHLGVAGVVRRMRRTPPWNFIPLSCAGHTMDLYRRLPAGWRTSPRDVPTDLHMYRQILDVPGCRVASGARLTVLRFPSRPRRDWSVARRLDELATWSERLADPRVRRRLREQAVAEVLRLDLERDSASVRWRLRELLVRHPWLRRLARRLVPRRGSGRAGR